MEFATVERMILLQILPQQGDFMTLKIARKLREDLSFSEEEHADLGITTDRENGAVRWRPEADKPKQIEVGPKALEIIRDTLKDLDRKKQLKMQQMDLYERFAVDKEE